jgi:hypothetical protein
MGHPLCGVEQVLYELVPLPVFCLMLLVPIVYFTVTTRMKTQTEEVVTRYRKNISDGLVAELEQEETDKLKKRKVRRLLTSVSATSCRCMTSFSRSWPQTL